MWALVLARVSGAWRGSWWEVVLRDINLLESFFMGATVAMSLAMSLLVHGTRGADEVCPPTHEVERDFRFAGLTP